MLIALDMCAGGRFLDWENVLDREAGDVLLYLDYISAKGHAEKKEMEYQRMKANAKPKR